jgi:Mg2+/citrate symporter
MTLVRTILVLGLALVIMLAVVLLRAETARLHYDISQREQEARALKQKLRAAEVELARLRNPVLLRARVADVLAELRETPAADDRRP